MSEPTRLLRSLDESRITGRHWRLYGVLVAGHFFDGYSVTMLGYILPSIAVAFKLNPAALGFLGSSVFIGMLLGALVIGTIGDIIGRRRSLMLSIGIYALFSLLAGLSRNYNELVVWRILEGFGVGGEIPVVLSYLTEFLPVKRRGTLLTLSIGLWQYAGVVAGILTIFLVPLFTWRVMFFIGVLPAALLLVLRYFIPESVRYQLRRGNLAEAERIVRTISTVDPASVTIPVQEGPSPRSSLRDVISGRYLPITVGIWVMMFIGGMITLGLGLWLPTVLAISGYGFTRSIAYAVAVNFAGATGQASSGVLADLWGRRVSIVIFFAVGSIFLALWGLANTPLTVVTMGVVAGYFAYAVLGVLLGYIGEVYPTRFRTTASGWANGWIRVAGIFSPIMLGYLLAAHVSNFFFFGLLSLLVAVGFLVAVFFAYETRNKRLEQVEEELLKKRG